MEPKIFLFPLNNSILFRKITLPYHIFEPRYKQMVHDAISTHTPIAVLPSGVTENYKGDICVGGIPHVLNSYPDGRMDIFITGNIKCRLSEFQDENPYKIYSYEPLLEVSDLRDDFVSELESLREFLAKWSLKFLPDASQRHAFTQTLSDNETLISYSALFLLEDMDVKKEIVETKELSRKVEILMKVLGPKEISLGPYLQKLKF